MKNTSLTYPTVSIVIPTLNSGSVLEKCLESVATQKYPRNKIEIIVSDGGSSDSTLSLAKKYDCRVIFNRLKTAEAGKAAGVKAARNDLIALIDSDNILPSASWMVNMVKPFHDSEIILSEPIRYTYRKSDPVLTRYFALIGMNDPICLFIGNYDRYSYVTNRWTDLKFREENKSGYKEITLDKEPIPTIGANGTFFRRADLLRAVSDSDYLFDIDIPIKLIRKNGKAKIAKVNVGIIHTFVENDPFKFFRKQIRRMDDMSYHRSRNNRNLDWESSFMPGILKFVFSCVLVLPVLYQAIIGFVRMPDSAWLFHPVACYSTFFIYIFGWLKGKISPSEFDRKNWKQ